MDRLEKQGIIEKIEFTEWAAPIVPVVKQDGSVRICGDYKVTVNTSAKVDAYPLPSIEDLFASLNGGTAFTSSLGRWQMVLDCGVILHYLDHDLLSVERRACQELE